MKKTGIILVLLMIIWTGLGFSQNGKFSGYMFGDYYYVLKNHNSDLQDKNGVQFRRIYFTYDKKLSDAFSSRVRLEMSNAGDFSTKSKMSPVVKDAYLKWKGSNFELVLGINPTPTWSVVEKIWGYRSVEKTPMDLQKFGSSRDLGLSIKGKLGGSGKIKYHAMIANGNSNSSETNKSKKGMLSLGFYPTKEIVVEVYGDWNANDGGNDWYTLQGFAAYNTSKMRFGLQFVQQTRQSAGSDDQTLELVSLFCVKKVSEKSKIFARVDKMLDPNPKGHKVSYIPFDNSAKSLFVVAGLDFAPIKSVHLMPNVELVKYDENEAGVTPDTDIIPRFTFYYKF